MLRPVKSILNYKILATDGEIGSVQDLYFDDHSWTIRYLVVDTGTWLPGRQVLISPRSIMAGTDEAIMYKIVYEPTRDEMFWAEKGIGAYLNDRRLRVSARRQPPERVRSEPGFGFGPDQCLQARGSCSIISFGRPGDDVRRSVRRS